MTWWCKYNHSNLTWMQHARKLHSMSHFMWSLNTWLFLLWALRRFHYHIFHVPMSVKCIRVFLVYTDFVLFFPKDVSFFIILNNHATSCNNFLWGYESVGLNEISWHNSPPQTLLYQCQLIFDLFEPNKTTYDLLFYCVLLRAKSAVLIFLP